MNQTMRNNCTRWLLSDAKHVNLEDVEQLLNNEAHQRCREMKKEKGKRKTEKEKEQKDVEKNMKK